MAVAEGTCAAPFSVDGKSRRAATGVVDGDDGEEEARLLGDQDGVSGDCDSAEADGDLSLATLPAEAEPNVLLAAGCCCCSGVVGSDDIPGLLDDDLRKILSGACLTHSSEHFFFQFIIINNNHMEQFRHVYSSLNPKP